MNTLANVARGRAAWAWTTGKKYADQTLTLPALTRLQLHRNQSLMTLLWSPDASQCPSGLIARQWMNCVCPMNVCTTTPESAFHSATAFPPVDASDAGKEGEDIFERSGFGVRHQAGSPALTSFPENNPYRFRHQPKRNRMTLVHFAASYCSLLFSATSLAVTTTVMRRFCARSRLLSAFLYNALASARMFGAAPCSSPIFRVLPLSSPAMLPVSFNAPAGYPSGRTWSLIGDATQNRYRLFAHEFNAVSNFRQRQPIRGLGNWLAVKGKILSVPERIEGRLHA
jgi:hypothetical protein